MALLAGSWMVCACGSRSLPLPKHGPQTNPDAIGVSVPSLPPVPKVSEIGPPPSSEYVWIDGQWMFREVAGRWIWQRGQWCVPPKDALYYSDPYLRRVRKVLRRITRWNPTAQRFEEVDEGTDRYLWIPGQWYVKTPKGGTKVLEEEPRCEPNVGIGKPNR